VLTVEGRRAGEAECAASAGSRTRIRGGTCSSARVATSLSTPKICRVRRCGSSQNRDVRVTCRSDWYHARPTLALCRAYPLQSAAVLNREEVEVEVRLEAAQLDPSLCRSDLAPRHNMHLGRGVRPGTASGSRGVRSAETTGTTSSRACARCGRDTHGRDEHSSSNTREYAARGKGNGMHWRDSLVSGDTSRRGGSLVNTPRARDRFSTTDQRSGRTS